MCDPKDWIHRSPPASTHHTCHHKQQQQQSRRYKLRLHCLVISGRRRCTENMEMKNLQLYMENRHILEENEKLRLKAIRLRLENQALLTEYQKKHGSCQTSA